MIGGGGYEIAQDVEMWLPHAAWSCYVTILSMTVSGCFLVIDCSETKIGLPDGHEYEKSC